MQSLSIHENLVYHDPNPYAEPLFVSPHWPRAAFCLLRPGEVVREHTAPSSPVCIRLRFRELDLLRQRRRGAALWPWHAVDLRCGRASRLPPAEAEEVVFLAFLHGAPVGS